MSNCHNLFQTFNGNLNIKPEKRKKLIKSRDNLRDKIRAHFKEKHSEYTPKFSGQGSYSLGTMIRTKEDTCDLDNGVYFFPKPAEAGSTIQKWVKDAVEGTTSTDPQHRKRCIRVIYVNDYHIDLPVYYKERGEDDTEEPHLAVKKEEWSLSDPRAFNVWFKDKKDKDGQLVKIVRYLKSWCDNKAKKMPTGLCMTVLATNNIKYDKRDDVCLRDTLKAIKKELNNNWVCFMPTTPKDELFESYTGSKDYFMESINDFIVDADKAIDDEKNQLKASKFWQKHLGLYFPDGQDKNVDAELNARIESLVDTAGIILAGNAKLNPEGEIQSGYGVQHKPHKNFGG